MNIDAFYFMINYKKDLNSSNVSCYKYGISSKIITERRDNVNQGKIGKFIAECRKKQKMTQEQLAEKLGVTDRAVSNWENGKNMPDLSMFKLLCGELKISINELMSGEELDESRYIKKLEENIITMVNNIEVKKKIKFKWALIILLYFLLIF